MDSQAPEGYRKESVAAGVRRMAERTFRQLALVSLLFLPPAALAEKYELPLFVASTTSGQQGMVRLLNHSDEPGTVEIVAIDDSGTRSSAATLTLGALAGTDLDASDLESGNAAKGVTGSLGSLRGNVRLEFDTELAVQLLAYLRMSDGTLSEMHGEASAATPGEDGGHSYLVPTFNAAQEMSQMSQLRLVNPTEMAATVSIEGRDDAGAAATGGSVRLTLPAGGAATLTAQQLEAGGTGLTGQLGTGSGRWRLRVSSDQPIVVISLVESSTGQLANLSASGRGVMEAPADASPRFAEGSGPLDRTYTVDTAIAALKLPEASGGDGALTYTLTPQVPGLAFDAATRQLTGTPTSAGTHSMTYRVTDSDGDADTLAFTITVHESDGGMVGAEGDCQVGLLVSPGESCTYPGTDSAFTVDADGRGRFLVITSTRAINLNKVTYQGTFYDFRASHQGDGVWRVDRLAGSSTPTTGGGGGGGSDTSPTFAQGSSPGNQTYRVGTAITTLVLPGATGGDGALTYELSPQVPGLAFDDATRQLTGTPTTAAAHTMTYRVTDTDGDTDTLSFTITVEASPGTDSSPSFADAITPGDQTYSVGTAIEALTLPTAADGDATLTYSLTPEIPGLTFNATSRKLTGTPTAAGTHVMTYTATDSDGDADTLTFTIIIEATPVDIVQFLRERPRVASAMLWAGVDNQPKPYTRWPRRLKEKLDLAIDRVARGEGSGLPEVMTNQAAEFLADNEYVTTVLSEEDAEDLYVANVANSLVLDAHGTFPWSLDDLSDHELELLLSSRGFYAAHVDYLHDANSRVTGYDVDGIVLPTSPEVVREFMVREDLIGDNRHETIVKATDWARYNLLHYSGGRSAKNFEDHWEYRGYSPLARMLVVGKATGGDGKPRAYTAGCHGTNWFFVHLLRAVNIPVEYVLWAGHAIPSFPSEEVYLSHGDDPYSSLAQYSPPFSEPFPSSEIPISEETYQEWFNESNSSEENLRNVGRRVTELGVEYLPQSLLQARCSDLANGLSNEDSYVYSPQFAGIGNFWTVEELEEMDFWERMDAKIEEYGGCSIFGY